MIGKFLIRPQTLLILIAISASSLSARAYGYGYGRGGSVSEEDHLISVGAGISSPSVTSAIGENPAGLTNNGKSKLLFEAASGNDQFDPIGLGGGFFTGNGSVGAGIGIQNFNNTLLNWGLAADIPNIDMSLGVSGTYTLNQSGSVSGIGTQRAWELDAGAIFHPHGDSRVGVTAFQVADGVDAVGAGYSLDPTPWATLAIDGVYSLKGNDTLMAKPGLALHVSGFEMAAGYGLRVQGSAGGWIPRGLSLAAGAPLGQKLSLQAYYNQIALYYAGLTVVF